ncbi:magnesium transporter [Campylobacter devanensis]|uniref:magnesium transporter n=1 Tax=Campylobacter devanensis TaxID=3161138 RepID=UPI000A34EF6B|nr:magnesium transporter [Campylobacter sp. P0106]
MPNSNLEEAKEQLQKHIIEENELSAADIASHLKILKTHDEDEYAKYLEKLDAHTLGEAAMEMPDHMLRDVIENIPNDKIAEAIDELESDDATDLIQTIEEIDEEKAKELFSSLEIDSQKEISKLINYEENEAGAYMQTELFSARLDESLSSAIARFRIMKQEDKIENVFSLFVVDNEGVLKHTIALEDLITYDFNLNLSQIVSEDEERFKPHFAIDSDDIKIAVDIIMDYDLSAIAVTNRAGVLLGRITTDDIHDFLEQSATEQIYNLAGVDDDAEEEGLVKTGRARAAWLFVNLITAILGVIVIGFFEKSIESLVALAVLMPIVASMGGNAGNQTLAVTVRRLALGEIGIGDFWVVLKKEIIMAIFNSFIFALFLGILVGLWFDKPMLGVVIAIALVANIIMAAFLGTFIPLSLKRIGLDPAVGSTVFLTTATDIIGFFVFLGLATWILL